MRRSNFLSGYFRCLFVGLGLGKGGGKGEGKGGKGSMTNSLLERGLLHKKTQL